LLIGIKYEHWRHLRFALDGTLRDVEDVKNHFLHQDKAAYKKENVVTLLEQEATAKGILDALDLLAAKANKDKDATVIVHYSGHGVTDGQNYFFAPYNFDIERWLEDETFDEKEVVLSKQFVEKIDNIQVDKKLIILDCCHSENIAERSLKKRAPLFLDGFINEPDDTSEAHATRDVSPDQMKKGSGSVILTSCKADETSLDLGDNGLFTKVLLESLNGAKNIEQDGWVRLIDMMRYIPSQVAERAPHHIIRGKPHKQHPVFKRIENIGHEDFIICAYDIAQARGLKPTPVTESKPVIMTKDYQYIRDMIAQGKVEKAIDETRTVAYQIKDKDIIAEVDLLSKRNNANEREKRLGVVSNDEYNKVSNKITLALLGLVDKLTPADTTGKNKIHTQGDRNVVIQGVTDDNVSINVGGNTDSTPPKTPAPAKADKDKILVLINSNIDKAHEMLYNIFEDSNGMYNDLSDQYITRPQGFSMTSHRGQLKMFVRRNL